MIKKRVKFYENDSLLTLMLSLIKMTYLLIVVPLGLEPRLFWTKTRRVASYTMGHSHIEDANLEQNFGCTNIFLK